MANATYEIMWRDAMGDLNEQLNVEGVEEEEDMPSHAGEGGQKLVRHRLPHNTQSSIPTNQFQIGNFILKFDCDGS